MLPNGVYHQWLDLSYCFGIEINSRISSKVLWSESLAVDLTVGLAAVAEVDVKVFCRQLADLTCPDHRAAVL